MVERARARRFLTTLAACALLAVASAAAASAANGASVRGSGWIVPARDARLPGADGRTAARFSVEARAATAPGRRPAGKVELRYGSFRVHAVTVDAVEVAGSNGNVRGLAQVDGRAGFLVYRLETHGNRLTLSLWPIGNYAGGPLYRASGDVAGGRIQLAG